MNTTKISKMGILVSLAMIFTYIEVLFPISIGIPGIKLGLANLVVVTGLYILGPIDVLLISVVRIILMGILFGNGASVMYSLAGGLLSFIIMLIFKKVGRFSVISVSICGGVFHNVGQIAVAGFMLQNSAIITYLPVLIVAGLITGCAIGIVSDRIIRIIKNHCIC